MDLLGTTAPVRELLVLDRSDLPGAKPWADAMRAKGAAVQYELLPGFPEMMSTPHAAQIPLRMIDAAKAWLTGLPDRLHSGVPPVRAAGALPAPASVRSDSMRMAAPDGQALTEQALHVDERRGLFAILTTSVAAAGTDSNSAGASEKRRGIVLLNAGATYRIGPNRMYVSLARRWAARGYVVLRLDLAGLGDSAPLPARPDNLVYPPGALDDIAAAIEFLRRNHAVQDITLAGLCAGAYHALRSAAAGLPVNLSLMINPLTYFWKEGMTMSDLQLAEVVRNPGIYRERILSGYAWLKLLRGRVNLWRIAMIFARRSWLACEAGVRDLSRRLGIRLPDDLGWDLQSIAGRGVRMVFVFARGDTGADLLRIQGGGAVDSIGDRCRVHTVDGADHIFSQSAPRARLEQLLGSELPV
jgi:alpha/beta superfamily hydrolase